MKKIEAYEDNGGGLHLCILNSDGNCTAIYTGWQHQAPGAVQDAAEQLMAAPEAWKQWDGEIHDEANLDLDEYPTTALYDEISNKDELVAWLEDGRLEHIPVERMGLAAKKALNISETDESEIDDADMMRIMIRDYLADHGDELEGLALDGGPRYDSDLETWVQDAHDSDAAYLLVAGGGNIRIEYMGQGGEDM